MYYEQSIIYYLREEETTCERFVKYMVASATAADEIASSENPRKTKKSVPC